MPSATFLNLPPKKQNILLEAARMEFSRVAYNQVSINQIVQNANISRGSFYMYFDSKEDLFLYLLQDFGRNMELQLRETLLHSGGNPFVLPMVLFDCILEQCEDENSARFFRNALECVHRRNNGPPIALLSTLRPKSSVPELHSLIDLSHMKLQKEEDLFDIVEILLVVTLNEIAVALLTPNQQKAARKRLENKIILLKQGLAQKEPAQQPEGAQQYA